jgi:hypothetical protein
MGAVEIMATLEELIAGTPPANQQAAGINADNVLNGNAAGAAKALELSRKSGLPASTIASDPPAFDKDFLQAMNAGIINSNEHVAKFTADNPVAASAMQNDFERWTPSRSRGRRLPAVSRRGGSPVSMVMLVRPSAPASARRRTLKRPALACSDPGGARSAIAPAGRWLLRWRADAGGREVLGDDWA